jgi:hypothetical protein
MFRVVLICFALALLLVNIIAAALARALQTYTRGTKVGTLFQTEANERRQYDRFVDGKRAEDGISKSDLDAKSSAIGRRGMASGRKATYWACSGRLLVVTILPAAWKRAGSA